MTYSSIRRETKKSQLDRQTWAGPLQLILTYELTGVGEHISEMISFGTVFESKPFFAWGVELANPEELTTGDFPTCIAGVQEWEVSETHDEDEEPMYLGARIFFLTDSTRTYRFLFRLSFEGVAMRNTEHFRE